MTFGHLGTTLYSDYSKIRNCLKVAYVERRDAKAEKECCGPDNKVFNRDGDSSRRLLTFDPPGQFRNLDGNGMDNHVAGELVDERLAGYPLILCFRSVDAMCQFDNADGRKRTLQIAMGIVDSMDNLLESVSTPFACVRMLESRISPMQTLSAVDAHG